MPTNSIFDFDERGSDCPLVDSVWRTTSGTNPGSFTSVAESHWGLVFTRQEHRTWVTIRGPETHATPAPIPEEAEFFGIAFKHGAFMPHIPTPELVDAPIDLPGSGRSFRFYGSAWDFPDFDNADTFFARLVCEGILVFDTVVAEALTGHLPDLSVRTVQRRVLRATGLTQGQLYQIQRAREAAAILEQGTSILDAVDRLGYADQSHLTRSLRLYWGQTPARILRGESA